jgi:glycosyltransferase involved in cell wall biosynthesis
MNKKKKLLIATDNFLPRWDGISRFLSQIIPEIKTDYDITIIAPRFKGKLKKISKVNIIRLPTHNFFIGDYQPTKLNIRKINQCIKKTDMLWVQTIGPIGGVAILLAKLSKKPIVAYIHSIESELVSKSIRKNLFLQKITYNIIKAFSRLCYNRCNLLLVPSLDTAEILSWQKIKTKKAIVNLGIDTNEFNQPRNKRRSKKIIGLKNSLVIGFTGRLGREKDLFTLYRAFLHLQKKYPINLLVVGDGLQNIKQYLKKKKNVKVIGPVSKIYKYLHAMDIFVMPSLTETSSLATMEAMSTGLPVITTPVGHMKNYVEDNYNGFTFKKKDYYVLSKKIEVLIRDEKLRNILGKNARNTIKEKYPWNNTVKKIKSILDIIIEK